jgi:3-oxoadipate enol-lactonase
MQTRVVSLPSLDISVLEAGGGGRPMLLVHGYTGAKEDFADHIDALAELGWWVVAPDLRGHGGTDHPEDPAEYSLERFSDDLVELVDELEWDRFVLLGHSMGGMVAQVLAIGHGHRLDGLVLMDTGHGPVTSIDRDTAALGAHIAAESGMAAIKEILDAMGADAPLDNEAYKRVARERPGHQEFSDHKLLTASPAMYGSMLLQLLDVDDRLLALAAVAVPTLVMVGELDADFIAPSAALAAAIGGARHDVLAGGGHSPQFESPDEWWTSLSGFLAGLGS